MRLDLIGAMVTGQASSAKELLAAARAFAPEVAKRRQEIDSARQLPVDIVERLRSMGIYAMGFSAELGGPGLTSLQQMEVFEALAYGDTATGWCAMIGAATGIYAGFLDKQALAELMPTRDLITAGLIAPSGRAVRTEGGYRLTGRWKLGSAINHADLVVGGAMIFDGDDMAMADGAPIAKMFCMRRDQVQVFDTWDSTGLRGSGSNDYATDDLFIPEHHCFDFFEPRSGTGKLAEPETLARVMPAIPLGATRAALDYVRDLAQGKVIAATGQKWADNYRAQYILGECEMEFIVARGAVVDSLRTLWDALDENRFAEIPPDIRIQTLLTRTHSYRACRHIVARLCELVGTESVYKPNPLDVWLRDMSTMTTHLMAHDQMIQTAGAFLLGGRPEFPLVLGVR